MKKLICVCLILCLSLALSAGVLAAQFANAYTLLQDWEENGYPDDVGSIYSTDGTPYNLTVQLVTDDFEARADEIRAMLDDPSTISFEKGTYTDKQLHEISSEIADAYVKEGTGVQSVAVGWGSNGKGFGASGKEVRVVVKVDDEKAIDLAQELGQKYGEAVFVEVSREDPEPMEEAEPAEEAEPEEEAAAAPEEAEDQLISPAPAEDAGAGTGTVSEETEARIISITFAVMGALLVFSIIFLIIFLNIRKRRKKRR